MDVFLSSVILNGNKKQKWREIWGSCRKETRSVRRSINPTDQSKLLWREIKAEVEIITRTVCCKHPGQFNFTCCHFVHTFFQSKDGLLLTSSESNGLDNRTWLLVVSPRHQKCILFFLMCCGLLSFSFTMALCTPFSQEKQKQCNCIRIYLKKELLNGLQKIRPTLNNP